MTQDQSFFKAVIDQPDNDTLRLVYADWLEEQSDPRSQFLRLEAELRTLPADSLRARLKRARLRQLRSRCDPAWLAQMDRTRIENCNRLTLLVCPQQWEKLRPTGEPDVRFCETCRKTVHYCPSIGEARRHASQGHCVAVDSRVERRPGDLGADRPRLPAGVIMGFRMPFPEPQPGQRVTIVTGRFAGSEGTAVRVRNGTLRVVVRLSGMGPRQTVEVDPEDLLF
jgi:uncharacterized protein (TIGR02996 family)